MAGVCPRRATPPGPRPPLWGLAGCRRLDPSHPTLVTPQRPTWNRAPQRPRRHRKPRSTNHRPRSKPTGPTRARTPTISRTHHQKDRVPQRPGRHPRPRLTVHAQGSTVTRRCGMSCCSRLAFGYASTRKKNRDFSLKGTTRAPSPWLSPRWGEWRIGKAQRRCYFPRPFRGEGARRAGEGACAATQQKPGLLAQQHHPDPFPWPSAQWGGENWKSAAPFLFPSPRRGEGARRAGEGACVDDGR